MIVDTGDARIAVTDRGGHGPTVLLIHGLAGSSREMLPTADALIDHFRVVLMDQRGHGSSTRRPGDLSRDAFVRDVVAVIETVAPAEKVTLVGQSMGAHTALLTAAGHPDMIERLVMLEGHPAGTDRPDEARKIGDFFRSWPTPFADIGAARDHLGESVMTEAWLADLETGDDGLRPRFDADVMERAIAAVHSERWAEWDELRVPTLAIFGERGMFTAQQKDELIARRPSTVIAEIADAGHDAHLEAFDEWTRILRDYLATH